MTDQHQDAERIDRVPPHELGAEMAVLGGMLMSQQAILDAVDILGDLPGAFYRPAHETIFNAICAQVVSGEPADPITVTDRLNKQGDLERVGGPAYLHKCVHEVVTAASTGWHAQIIRNLFYLRRVIETGTRLVQMGYEGRADPDQAAKIIDNAAAELQALTSNLGSKSDSREWSLDQILELVVDEYDSPTNRTLPLPWKDLQEAVPMEPGDLVVIGARPAMGKSVVLADIARHVAIKHRMRVLVASMEMSHLQLGQRIVSAEATAELHNLRNRRLTPEKRDKMYRKVADMAGAPLFIDDRPRRSVSDWRKRLRQLQAQDQLPAALIVDYLQICEAESRPGTNRTVEVDAIAAGLKALAQEFGIVVIAAAQVNRLVTYRADATPTMADLRESGGIEANANIVILLHREDAYEKESPRAGEFDFIVAKNRMGQSGTRITAAFQGHYSRVVPMGRE